MPINYSKLTKPTFSDWFLNDVHEHDADHLGEELEWNLTKDADFSIADIAAASQLSIIDYLGDIPWDGYKNAKIWYSKIKSRPSFKDILNDTIKGILPAKHYANLDF